MVPRGFVSHPQPHLGLQMTPRPGSRPAGTTDALSPQEVCHRVLVTHLTDTDKQRALGSPTL
jgi:hypothetical protein